MDLYRYAKKLMYRLYQFRKMVLEAYRILNGVWFKVKLIHLRKIKIKLKNFQKK